MTPDLDRTVHRIDAGARIMTVLTRVLVAVLAFLAVFLPLASWGHGEADWIMNNPETAHCCGPQDCQPIPDEIVTMDEHGYNVEWNGQTHRFHFNSTRNLYPSKDQRFWMCVYLDDEESFEGGTPRCLFPPAWGM